METLTLISGRRRIGCSNPVYHARHDNRVPSRHIPSHLVAWPGNKQTIDEICYVQLTRVRVPVLVTPQADGSIWLGGAYLDTIADELRLIPHILPNWSEDEETP
jgi:hypothetical protein